MTPLLTTLAGPAGTALAVVTGAIDRVRRPAKPLHPHGRVTHAVLHRRGSAVTSGVPWIDEPGRDEVLVRTSRAVGLPAPLPDVLGIALRVSGPHGAGDLLLATTGRGRLSRYALTAHRDLPHAGLLTTLLPYRTDAGPVLLAARPRGPAGGGAGGDAGGGDGVGLGAGLDLAWARGSGPWQWFAELEAAPSPGTGEDGTQDADVSFDPVRRVLPGLEQYPWVARLRAPAYARARQAGRAGRAVRGRVDPDPSGTLDA
ncbi:MAG: putative phosphodiesterase [Marmoricola sp.]|nr:putative phosphodiesterase [Marmoricola sp.]